MVRINEIDSARKMDELKSSISMLGRMVPDCEVPDSKLTSALKKLLTADFKRRVYMEEQRGTTEQLIPERKTNCLHDP